MNCNPKPHFYLFLILTQEIWYVESWISPVLYMCQCRWRKVWFLKRFWISQMQIRFLNYFNINSVSICIFKLCGKNYFIYNWVSGNWSADKCEYVYTFWLNLWKKVFFCVVYNVKKIFRNKKRCGDWRGICTLSYLRHK